MVGREHAAQPRVRADVLDPAALAGAAPADQRVAAAGRRGGRVEAGSGPADAGDRGDQLAAGALLQLTAGEEGGTVRADDEEAAGLRPRADEGGDPAGHPGRVVVVGADDERVAAGERALVVDGDHVAGLARGRDGRGADVADLHRDRAAAVGAARLRARVERHAAVGDVAVVAVDVGDQEPAQARAARAEVELRLTGAQAADADQRDAAGRDAVEQARLAGARIGRQADRGQRAAGPGRLGRRRPGAAAAAARVRDGDHEVVAVDLRQLGAEVDRERPAVVALAADVVAQAETAVGAAAVGAVPGECERSALQHDDLPGRRVRGAAGAAGEAAAAAVAAQPGRAVDDAADADSGPSGGRLGAARTRRIGAVDGGVELERGGARAGLDGDRGGRRGGAAAGAHPQHVPAGAVGLEERRERPAGGSAAAVTAAARCGDDRPADTAGARAVRVVDDPSAQSQRAAGDGAGTTAGADERHAVGDGEADRRAPHRRAAAGGDAQHVAAVAQPVAAVDAQRPQARARAGELLAERDAVEPRGEVAVLGPGPHREQDGPSDDALAGTRGDDGRRAVRGRRRRRVGSLRCRGRRGRHRAGEHHERHRNAARDRLDLAGHRAAPFTAAPPAPSRGDAARSPRRRKWT